DAGVGHQFSDARLPRSQSRSRSIWFLRAGVCVRAGAGVSANGAGDAALQSDRRDATGGGQSRASASVTAAARSGVATIACRVHRQALSVVPVNEVVAPHWSTGAWLLLANRTAYGALQLYPYMIAGLGAAAVAADAAARNVVNALNVLAQAGINYLPLAAKR